MTYMDKNVFERMRHGGADLKQRPVRRTYILILIIVSILAVVIGFKYVLPLFFPFIVGYFLAWIAAPIVRFLQRRFKIPRGIASIVVVSIFLLLCILSVYYLFKTALMQIRSFVENLPFYQTMLFDRLKGVCFSCDHWLGFQEGTSYDFVSERINGALIFLQNNVLPGESDQAIDIAKEIFDVIWNIVILFITTLLLVKDFGEYKKEFQESCFYKEIHMVTGVLSDMGIAYLKAQFILMCITATICTIGIFITGNHYAILIGAGIAVFDAFPILGSAFILIPWAIILMIKKEVAKGFVIVGTYIICELIRQILEPKLVGDRIGIRPVYTLISMYVGLKIYGTFGFVLGPISLIAIRAIVRMGMEKLRQVQESSGNEIK